MPSRRLLLPTVQCRVSSSERDLLTGGEKNQSGSSVNDTSSLCQNRLAPIGDALVDAPVVCGRVGCGQGTEIIRSDV